MSGGSGGGSWRKSSYSTTNGCVEVHMHWRKSSYSGGNGCVEVGVARTSSHSALYDGCVEVEGLPEGWVAVRDTKDREGPVLRYNPTEWQAFLDGVRGGEFDLP
jgi:hypothetical protein